ncbi:hypothetical protein TNCV_2320031 [Trichonephila clavipes]|nr:hypothetical protein TNCV_2320031 [Trichonephila clavipes]
MMLGMAKVVFSILLSGMTVIGRAMESGTRGYGSSSGWKVFEFFIVYKCSYTAFALSAHKKFNRFSNIVQSRHPETMTRRKGLSPDEVAKLLIELTQNVLDGVCVCGELSYSNLDTAEDIRLHEGDCEESEKSADVIDNIPVNQDI